MPKADIRSFFAPINSKKSQQNSDQVTKKPVLSHSQKKRAIIIDSDSDEESSPVPIKRSKPSSEEKKSNSHKKSGRAETKSKYFECLDVSVNDIFKDTPIKRDTSRKIVKRIAPKEDKEIHFDKEFEEELANLDDTWFEKSTSDTLITSTSKEKQVEKVNGVKESPKKTDVANICRRSPRKNYSDDSESPKKKLRKASPANGLLSLHSPEKSPKKSLSNKSPVNKTTSNTPEKSSFNLCSPEKSPKRSLFSKSPLSKGKSKTPEKSPYKKLSLTRGNKECLNREELSHTHNTNVSTTKASNDSPTSKESPKKRVSEKCLPNEISDFNQNKKDSTAKVSERTVRKVSERIDKKEDPVTNEDSNKNVQKDPSPVGGKPLSTTAPSNLWVERYKPTSTKQIIGQQGEKSCVNKLIAWLKNWEKNQSGTKKLVKPSPWAKNDDGSFFKAALLSGPPGVGKTTTAHLVCKELGFDVVEFNASDTRSKRLLHEEVSELLSTKSLSPFFTGKGDQVTKKHVLLMDEVDGMAGNEDRGGVQELISLIKQSRVPVICMCNDRNHPKIRSLSNYCFDLRFSKPRVEQIRGAMMSVCFKEKLKLKPDELADIITSANQDIRLVMNHLSMLATHKTGMANSTKHIKMGPWDIVRKIFSEQDHKSMTIHDKCDLFFHDYSVTPLFVHENYLNAVPHGAEAKNKIKKMELFARTAKSLSFGDITEKSIRSNNAWGLLPVQAVFSSLVPGDLLEGHLGAQINFPAWFGKNSRQTKMNRLVQELTVHSRLKISGNREAMNLDYVTSLGSAITGPLLQDGVDGVSTALSVLSEYCLVREDMESIAELSTWPGCRNRFSDVDSKVKAAFTRAYNKTSAPTPYAAVAIKKGRGDVDTADGEEDDSGSQDVDEEEEGLEADGMIMVKKKPVGKKADKDVQPCTSRGGKASSSRGSKRGRKK